MVATDIDAHSIAHAELNIKRNGLEERIDLVLIDPAGRIFPDDIFLVTPE